MKTRQDEDLELDGYQHGTCGGLPPGAELQPFLATTGGKLWWKALYFPVVPLSAVFIVWN